MPSAKWDTEIGNRWVEGAIEGLVDIGAPPLDKITLAAVLLSTVCIDGSVQGRKLSGDDRMKVAREMSKKFMLIAQAELLQSETSES